jgi:hypothetical protein
MCSDLDGLPPGKARAKNWRQNQQQQRSSSNRARIGQTEAATAGVSNAGVPTAAAASYKHNAIVRDRVRGVGGIWMSDARSSSCNTADDCARSCNAV